MSKKQSIVDSYYNQLIKDIELLKTNAVLTSLLKYPTNDEIKEYLNNNIVEWGGLGYQLQADRDFLRFYLALDDFNKIRHHCMGRLISYGNLKLFCSYAMYNDTVKFIKAN